MLSLINIAVEEHYEGIKKNTQMYRNICFDYQNRSWNRKHFNNVLLKGKLITFLKDPDNTIDPHEVCFVHDKTSGLKARNVKDEWYRLVWQF